MWRVIYKVRGADCTVPSKEMARVERWRKLLLNMVVIVVFLLGAFVFGICGLDGQVRLVCR